MSIGSANYIAYKNSIKGRYMDIFHNFNANVEHDLCVARENKQIKQTLPGINMLYFSKLSFIA
jgi:hypothetical protein